MSKVANFKTSFERFIEIYENLDYPNEYNDDNVQNMIILLESFTDEDYENFNIYFCTSEHGTKTFGYNKHIRDIQILDEWEDNALYIPIEFWKFLLNDPKIDIKNGFIIPSNVANDIDIFEKICEMGINITFTIENTNKTMLEMFVESVKNDDEKLKQIFNIINIYPKCISDITILLKLSKQLYSKLRKYAVKNNGYYIDTLMCSGYSYDKIMFDSNYHVCYPTNTHKLMINVNEKVALDTIRSICANFV